MGSAWPSVTRRIGAAVAAGLLGLALYLNTAANDFVFDDANIVRNNPLALDPGDLRGIFGTHYWSSTTAGGNLYRPLTIWSFALNHALTGPGPAGHHVANAFLHGAVSALVALLGAALGLGAGGSLAAGLLFAAHPIHVEAVAPVVGRSELLAALFGLAAWLCHLAARNAEGGGPGRGRGARTGLLAASAALFGAALLCKEGAAVLPALVLAGDLVVGRRARTWGRLLRTPLVMGAVLAGWLLLRARAVPGLPPDDPLGSVFGGIDPLTRILTAIGVLGRYLWLIVYPVRLSADYSYSQIPLISSPLDALFILSALAHLGIAVAGFFLAARRRLSGLALLIYLGALFPISNIPISIGTVMGERLLYLPSVGLCLLAPALFQESRFAGSRAARRTAAAALAVACALYSARVIVRNGDWRDARTLFTATVRTSPNSAKAHYNLGVAEEERGDRRAAMRAYRRAIEIRPEMPQARRNYGLSLLQEGRPAEAREHLDAAARLDPDIPDVFNDLGIALHQIGRLDEAEHAFREELRRRPGGERAWYNLGSLLLEEGNPSAALPSLDRALALSPGDADAHAQRGAALAALGRSAEAAAAFEQALRLDPAMVEVLVPLARAALAAGREDLARSALGRAAAAGVPVPADLGGIAP